MLLRDEGRQLALEIVAAGARLEQAGLIMPGEGNLSARQPAAGSCLVTPCGRDKGRLSITDLVEMAIHGAPPAGASSDARFHLAVYRARPNAAAVVHAHPPCVQLLAARGVRPDPALLEAGPLVIGQVGWIDHARDDGVDLAEVVPAAFAAATACVLPRHGAVTVGASVAEALRRMLLLERLAHLTLGPGGR